MGSSGWAYKLEGVDEVMVCILREDRGVQDPLNAPRAQQSQKINKFDERGGALDHQIHVNYPSFSWKPEFVYQQLLL